ncbi:MFS transporter [Apiospora arundinis]
MVAFNVLPYFVLGAAVSGARIAPTPPRDQLTPTSAEDGNCKCFPGDPCWPSESEWAAFNRTVGGRLVATVPLAAPCHHSPLAPYDPVACAAVRSTWWFPETHLSSSSSPMAPFFANASCDPFTRPEDQCVLGAYPQYAVRAAGAADYQATLAFAAARRLRLVVRNTGHDYFGKSTGAGALALWTHWLKDTAVLGDYASPHYRGPALRLGAGVEGHEAYAAADAAGLAVVGGNCATVGVAGGWSQGAGHGPLNSRFGLGADQVLEWEVVTAGGRHMTASPADNSDLYWALSGGGGGTYAAVVSVTVRAHRLTVVSAATLSFTNAGVSNDTFYEAVQTYVMSLPALTQGGTWSSWLLTPGLFSVAPVVGPELGAPELETLLRPTLEFLNKSGISYQYRLEQFDSFLKTYDTMFSYNNITEYNLGGRLIPKSLVETKSSAAALIDAIRYINKQGGAVFGLSMDVSGFPTGGIQNSVNPAWRSAIMNMVIGLPYDAFDFKANKGMQETMTKVIMPRVEALTPGGGAYSNEGDFQQPDWQHVFYGKNYEALQRVKDKYDPHGLFYGLTAVGSERWTVQEDGRLCRVNP